MITWQKNEDIGSKIANKLQPILMAVGMMEENDGCRLVFKTELELIRKAVEDMKEISDMLEVRSLIINKGGK